MDFSVELHLKIFEHWSRKHLSKDALWRSTLETATDWSPFGLLLHRYLKTRAADKSASNLKPHSHFKSLVLVKTPRGFLLFFNFGFRTTIFCFPFSFLAWHLEHSCEEYTASTFSVFGSPFWTHKSSRADWTCEKNQCVCQNAKNRPFSRFSEWWENFKFSTSIRSIWWCFAIFTINEARLWTICSFMLDRKRDRKR